MGIKCVRCLELFADLALRVGENEFRWALKILDELIAEGCLQDAEEVIGDLRYNLRTGHRSRAEDTIMHELPIYLGKVCQKE